MASAIGSSRPRSFQKPRPVEPHVRRCARRPRCPEFGLSGPAPWSTPSWPTCPRADQPRCPGSADPERGSGPRSTRQRPLRFGQDSWPPSRWLPRQPGRQSSYNPRQPARSGSIADWPGSPLRLLWFREPSKRGNPILPEHEPVPRPPDQGSRPHHSPDRAVCRVPPG